MHGFNAVSKSIGAIGNGGGRCGMGANGGNDGGGSGGGDGGGGEGHASRCVGQSRHAARAAFVLAHRL